MMKTILPFRFRLFGTTIILAIVLISCKQKETTDDLFLCYAQKTLDALYENFEIENSNLLRETYPIKENYSVTYLGNGESISSNPYSYLWPYSGVFSAVSALLDATQQDRVYSNILTDRVLPGLEEYLDTIRKPVSYASYVNTAPLSDRFYDDNIWLGIDFVDVFQHTGNKIYLEKSRLIWKFIESGMDKKLDGGIYWCEQKRKTKNTCSNAPGSVYALKVFIATSDSSFLNQGISLYEWTKEHLQDSIDHLYFDNISLNGKIDKTKYAYNSGQMLQSAVLLYRITKDEKYLNEARKIAESCHNFFFKDFVSPQGEQFKLLKGGNTWFIAVMFRGFQELYKVDQKNDYVESFRDNLEYAWKNSRDENGLFNKDWSGVAKDNTKDLLTQAAMVELYARVATVYQIKK